MQYNRLVITISLSFSIMLAACQQHPIDSSANTTLCNALWYQKVESQIMSGDGQGHGPDLGSNEWQSVIEFKLGIRGLATTPARDTLAWCKYIDGLVFPNPS